MTKLNLNHHQRDAFQAGFTLIELMIVVAIIGILAAIAIPQYQNYVARSQVSRVMAETGQLRTAVETCLLSGQAAEGECFVGTVTSDLISSLQVESVAVTGDGTNGAALTEKTSVMATFESTASGDLPGKTLTWTRGENGNWSCETTADVKYTPAGCTSTDS